MSKKINKEVSEQEEVVEEIDEALQMLLDSYSPESFSLGQGTYRLVKEYRDGFDYEAVIKRFNDVLDKYDYIVGDWGYDQLRLKGFFKDDFKSAPIDAKISTVEDYIYEYCNFGCAYFVIEQIGEFKRRGRTTHSQPRKSRQNKGSAHTEEKRYDSNKSGKGKPRQRQKTVSKEGQKKTGNRGKNTPTSAPVKQSTKDNRHFKIRKKED